MEASTLENAGEDRAYWDGDLLITFTARVRKETYALLKEYKNFAYAVETREKVVNHAILSYLMEKLDKRDVSPEYRARVEKEFERSCKEINKH